MSTTLTAPFSQSLGLPRKHEAQPSHSILDRNRRLPDCGHQLKDASMTKLTDTIHLKRWQAYLLLAMSGFAVGNILAKTTAMFGL